MKIETYIQKTSNLYAENRILKFAVLCMCIAVVISSMFSYAAMKYQRVVILPPVVDSRVVISGNEVNDNYVRLFTRYIMAMLNNYTPGSAQSQFDELLNLAAPSFYPALQKTLDGLADTITRLNITSTFFPQKIAINTKAKKITITGLRKQFTNATLVENGEKQYIITYVIENGRFYVSGIEEAGLKN